MLADERSYVKRGASVWLSSWPIYLDELMQSVRVRETLLGLFAPSLAQWEFSPEFEQKLANGPIGFVV
jgi:hypothetical protein